MPRTRTGTLATTLVPLPAVRVPKLIAVTNPSAAFVAAGVIVAPAPVPPETVALAARPADNASTPATVPRKVIVEVEYIGDTEKRERAVESAKARAAFAKCLQIFSLFRKSNPQGPGRCVNNLKTQ